MHLLEKFYNTIVKYELLNKYNYNNTKSLPKLKSITLNFGCPAAEINRLASGLLALELISNQKGHLTRTKYSKILYKVRKGNPTGCKVTLNKFNKFKFLELLIIEIFPKLKNFNCLNFRNTKKFNNFSYELKHVFNFIELEKNYYLFSNIPNLNISMSISSLICTKKKEEELKFLLNTYQLPFKN